MPPNPKVAQGACLCGKITFEIDIPAVWAWHDHSPRTQHAHGAACATYIGTWRSRLRLTSGQTNLTTFTDPTNRQTRTFCKSCGTPVFHIRPHSPKMLNIPRALFSTRTGREPRYHVGFERRPDWAYRDEKLAPLKGYPGVLHQRPKQAKRVLF